MMNEANMLMEKVEHDFKKVGLYLEGAKILDMREDPDAIENDAFDLAARVTEGGAPVMLVATFMVGNRAFTNKVLDPDKWSEEARFKAIMPTRAEMLLDKLSDISDDDDIVSFIGGLDD